MQKYECQSTISDLYAVGDTAYVLQLFGTVI